MRWLLTGGTILAAFALLIVATVVEGRTFRKPDFHLETADLLHRLGTALGLLVLVPPAALDPLVDTGLGEKNACEKA